MAAKKGISPIIACTVSRVDERRIADRATGGSVNNWTYPLFRGWRAVLFVVALVSAATMARGQEWTRFRGPNGSGQSEATTIPVAWSEKEYLWKTDLPGIGHSSPVLWGQKIFLTSADPASGTRYVLGLSASDGKLLWKREYRTAANAVHTQNSLASSTPTVDQDHVYCAWATPEEFTLLALAHDGSEAWRVNLGPFISKHGFGTSPILYGDMVIVTDDQDADSFLIAVDRASGLTRWKVPRKVHPQQSTSYSAPCIYKPKNGPAELIVNSWAHGMTSVDPLSGKTNWEAEVLERRPVGSPIIVEGLILGNCGEGSGNNNVVAVRPGNASGRKPELIYKLDKTYAPYVPSLVAKGFLVFLWGDRGVVACIDGRSGQILWRERVGGNYSSSPVQVAGRVYCVSTEGEVVAVAAADQYKLLGRSSLGEPSRATPAIAAGRMILRTESHLFAVGQK
ncbi:MAG: PQQ-binding-like beta-propeller repeat protein [Planctomycetia bacterium]|nr:PQQ-binding-like beta-propeller repeat protein [Planctomycetia bacterium]